MTAMADVAVADQQEAAGFFGQVAGVVLVSAWFGQVHAFVADQRPGSNT